MIFEIQVSEVRFVVGQEMFLQRRELRKETFFKTFLLDWIL